MLGCNPCPVLPPPRTPFTRKLSPTSATSALPWKTPASSLPSPDAAAWPWESRGFWPPSPRRRRPASLWPARRFALAFFPAVAAAAALTTVLVSRAEFDLLPAIWLLLYGVAISAGGALSVRVVPFMGLALLLTGGAALLVPFATSNLLLGLGFGLIQIGGGLVIIRRYGG